MNFQFYIEKLKNSEIFKKFINDNKEAFPCSGFFVVDKQGQDNKQHIDFFIPKENKMISFQLENKCSLVPLEIQEGFKPERISLKHDFEFNAVEKIIQAKMANKGIKNSIQKFLFSLQHKGARDFLVGTVFISNFGLLKVNIDLTDMEIIHFEKKSFFDMLKITKSAKKEDKPFEKVSKPDLKGGK